MTIEPESIIAIVSSALSSLRFFSNKLDFTFLKGIKPFADDETRRLLEGLVFSVTATVFWALTYNRQRIDVLSPEGFISLLVSVLTGPIAAAVWIFNFWQLRNVRAAIRGKLGIPERISEAHFQERRAKFTRFAWVFIVLAIVFPLGVGLLGYTYGLVRPYKTGVVIAQFAGIDTSEQVRFKDSLQIRLEQLKRASDSQARYYGAEVGDFSAAERAAFETNQRFVVWGSIYLEEATDNYSANILIRVRDASRHVDTYSSRGYESTGTTKDEIINHAASDVAAACVWTLGLAQTGFDPSYHSAVEGTQKLAQLASEMIHENSEESKQLSVFLMDIGYQKIFDRLAVSGRNSSEIVRICAGAISSLETSHYQGSQSARNSALARLYYLRAKALEYGSNGENRDAEIHDLKQSIALDPQYPMPHYWLAWIDQHDGGSNDDAAQNCRDFLQKLEVYGRWKEDVRAFFSDEFEEVNRWLGSLTQEPENELRAQ